MKTIAAAQFKARCLTLMDDVESTREPLVITKRGRPVAKLVPAENGKDDFIGSLKGVFKIAGDIESPAVPPEDWESSL
jgi:prevent-host-death family protein